MSYYRGDCSGRGDYYRGDYYRGDVFGFLKKAVGGVAKAVGGLGIPVVSGVARAVSGVLTKPSDARIPIIAPPAPPQFGLQFQTPIISGGGGFSLGPGQAGVPALPLSPMALAMCQTKGYRVNKSTYITRGGGTSRWPPTIIVHPKGTECVKSRRMNVANPRALRRAIRRTRGFAKLARKAIRIQMTYGKKGGRKKK